ncbi:Rrf2 family transcriptional regulator [Arhodomonas sp. AD133]|uniref:Rrf2 family transcriptional regulator n=1 Tax=Arhodomonas sp. AD133 TaxID=3415009 RepID=UPI003EBC2C0C
MKLTTKARYAVTAMAVLALRGSDTPTALADIGESQGISLSYLEQLFASLRRAGLVAGMRGPGGGYRLARAPGAISIAEVVAAVDDPEAEPEGSGEHCLTHGLWRELSGHIYDFLDGITLEAVAADPAIVEAFAGDADESA